MRLPTAAEFKRFLAVDGWTERAARGGTRTGDHWRFERTLADGTVLRTKVSHGSGSAQIADAGLFKHILRDQLRVTEDEFWLAVDKSIAPSRPEDRTMAPPAAETLPHDLVSNLVRKAGLTPQQVGAMSKDEAVAAWQHWLTHRARPTA